MWLNELQIVHPTERFDHPDACRIFHRAVESSLPRTIVIDLARANDASTSAFARLIILRRVLRRSGRDLCLTGLRERAAKVYEVNRLAGVLPVR